MIEVQGEPSWYPLARCRTNPPEDTEMFFPGRGRPDIELSAKAFCSSGCPVIDRCLAYALDNHEDGVWGGTTAKERIALRRKAREDRVGRPVPRPRRAPDGMATARELRAMLVQGATRKEAAARGNVRVSRVYQADQVLTKIRSTVEVWKSGERDQRKIAEAAGVDEKWVFAYLAEAADLGLITPRSDRGRS